jgi:hypothetical protein
MTLEITRYIIGGLLFLFAMWGILCNWASIFINIQNQRKDIDRNVSMVPIIGGLLLPISFFIMPLGLTWHTWFLALLDPSILSIVFLFPMLMISINLKRRKSS